MYAHRRYRATTSRSSHGETLEPLAGVWICLFKPRDGDYAALAPRFGESRLRRQTRLICWAGEWRNSPAQLGGFGPPAARLEGEEFRCRCGLNFFTSTQTLRTAAAPAGRRFQPADAMKTKRIWWVDDETSVTRSSSSISKKTLAPTNWGERCHSTGRWPGAAREFQQDLILLRRNSCRLGGW